MKYAIQISVFLSNGKEIVKTEKAYFIPNNSFSFASAFDAKVYLANFTTGRNPDIGRFGKEVSEQLSMKIVEVPDDTEFLTFPDPVQVPLLSTVQTAKTGRYNQFGVWEPDTVYEVAEFQVAVIAPKDIAEQMKKLRKESGKELDVLIRNILNKKT